MRWPQGHEKMVTFGQNIGVPGSVKGLWCYKAELDAVRAVYTGYTMTWELWAVPLLQYLTGQREARPATGLEVIQTVMRLLYYQNGFYLTVPGDIRRAIVKWAYQYLKDGAAPFPFVGDMGSDSYQFTIDFQRDTALKENINYSRRPQRRKSRPPNRETLCRFDRGQVDNCRTPRTRFHG